MTRPNPELQTKAPRLRKLSLTLLSVTAVAILATGCRPFDNAPRVAGWSLIDPSQRHPILVSQEPATIGLKVPRGSYGLSPRQRARLMRFLEHYRNVDTGNSHLIIEAPSGSRNEVAAMQAVTEIRVLMQNAGFDPASVTVEAYQAPKSSTPPVRIAYTRYVAQAPQCGIWPDNLAKTKANLNYPNLGCATQANLAAMIANPADLVQPRTMTPASAERRNDIWDKYLTGKSTISEKSGDERVSITGN